MKFLIGAIILIFAISACNSSKTPKDAKIVDINSLKGKKSYTFSVANFSLNLSDSWEEETPSNNMRVAQFKLVNNPEYQVVVSYFGNMDNKVEENIDRWEKQFSTIEDYSELELNAKEITAIKLIGTYKNKPFPMAQDFVETPNYGTLAAIIPSNEGPYFIKLTAPENIITEQKEIFIEVLNSYSIK